MKSKFEKLFVFVTLMLISVMGYAQNWTWTGETPHAEGSYYLYNVGSSSFVGMNNGAPVNVEENSALLFKLTEGLDGTDLQYTQNGNTYYIYQSAGTYGYWKNQEANVQPGPSSVTMKSFGDSYRWKIKAYNPGYQIYSNHKYSYSAGGWFGIGATNKHESDTDRYIRYTGSGYDCSKNKDEYNNTNGTFLFITDAEKTARDNYVTAYNALDACKGEKTISLDLKNRISQALNDNNSASSSNAESKTSALNALVTEYNNYIASLSTATKESGKDVTGIIVNPGFESSTWDTGWTAQGFGEHENAGQFGGAHIAEMYESPDWNRGESSGSIKQTISNLPAGCYKLTAKATGGVGKDASKGDGDYLYVTVGNESPIKTFVPNTTDVAYDYSVDFVISSESNIEIGFERINSMWWSAVDDFTLTYYGPIDEIILNIRKGCYGTFVAPMDVTLPDGVIAFSASSPINDEVKLTEIPLNDQLLPAGTPVIVRMNDRSAMNKTYYGPKATGTVTENGLLGFYETGTIIPNGCYVLQDQDKGQGQMFYVVDNEKSAMTSSKNRCCLNTGGSGAKVLSITFAESEETAVGTVSASSTPVGYYSVNGAKLSAPKAGVNIVKMSDGTVKKVLVK